MSDTATRTDCLCDAGIDEIQALCDRGRAKHENAELNWVHMDAEWLDRFDDAQHPDTMPAGFQGDPAPILAQRTKLRNILLSIGGTRASIVPNEPDLEEISSRGKLYSPIGLRMRSGKNNRCHGNAARLWDKNRDRFLICTGYALCDSGLWRQHSWCLHIKPRSVNVMETTVPAAAYFGFALSLQEAKLFQMNNRN